jgi:hypothetical protein
MAVTSKQTGIVKNTPKILLLDIETAPHRVYSWGLWKQDIHIDRIIEPGEGVFPELHARTGCDTAGLRSVARS